MNERQVAAWIAAGLMTLVVSGLFLRRSTSLARPGSRYRILEKVTIVATAIAVGALMGLGTFLIVSAFGG